jgi:hypothetical protein
VLGEVHVSPPHPHPGSGRYRARACADVLIHVTVRACPTEGDLVPVATGLLYDDLTLLRQFVDIIDAPTVFDAEALREIRQGRVTSDTDLHGSDRYGSDRYGSDPYVSDPDDDGDQGPEGDADGDSSWDRFLDPFDEDDAGLGDDGDWAYPDPDRPDTDIEVDPDDGSDTESDTESDTGLLRLRRARRTFTGEWDDEVFETVHNYLGLR